MRRRDELTRHNFAMRLKRAANNVCIVSGEEIPFTKLEVENNSLRGTRLTRHWYPDELAEASRYLTNLGLMVAKDDFTRFHIPDEKAPDEAGWIVRVNHNPIRKFSKPIPAQMDSMDELVAWQVWCRQAYQFWMQQAAVVFLADRTIELNTWGQVRRFWPTTLKFMDPSIREVLARHAQRSAMPKNWENPSTLYETIQLANRIMAQAMLIHNDGLHQIEVRRQNIVMFEQPAGHTSAYFENVRLANQIRVCRQ